MEYARDTVTHSALHQGREKIINKEEKSTDLFFKLNQLITKLKQGGRFITEKTDNVRLNISSSRWSFFKSLKKLLPLLQIPSHMCSHILYSYSEQGTVPCARRRGIKFTVYRTHTKQMLLCSVIDLSKWYMSNIDDTIRMSHLSLASLQREMGCHLHSN